nr:transposase [Desulfitibacter alkalitolerans]
MQRRENYLYVGMDLHKDTHTAVLVNCWNEKLDAIVIENKPSEFNKLAKKVARCLEQQKEEIALVDCEIERMLRYFDYKLTTIPGVNIAIASKLIAEIGDIRRFPSADKLARMQELRQ